VVGWNFYFVYIRPITNLLSCTCSKDTILSGVFKNGLGENLMESKLNGKIALITGSGAGIGRATVRLLAAEGVTVIVVDINAETGKETVKLIEADGGKAVFIEADVSKTDQVNAMVDQSAKMFGGIDILHANAGVPGCSKLLKDWTDEDWDEVLAVNLSGVFKCCRAAIPVMRRGGSIIIASSIAGIHAIPWVAAYNASKAGVIAITQTLALECGEMGIRVNAIAPGIIMTAMGQATIDELGDSFNVKTMVPIQRLGEPEDIAQAVLYLASDMSSYVTGAVLTVDGGTTIRHF